MLRKTASILGTVLLLAVAADVNAALVVDTGNPTGSGFPLALDGTDWLAGQVQLTSASQIDAVKGYITGANAGDSFTISLYNDSSNHVGSWISSAGATFGADGWNGVTGQAWNVGPGKYWLALEVQGSDTMAFGTAPLGAPSPLALTAFNAGSGYQNYPMSFGLQVNATPTAPVPEPETYAMMLAGLGLIGFTLRRRNKVA